MSNLQILIDYGTNMVRSAKDGGYVLIGLQGANLTKKEVKIALHKIHKMVNRNMTVKSIDLNSGIVIEMI